MSYDGSGVQRERFSFWSKMEIFRVGAIAGLAIMPLSVAAIDAPKTKQIPPVNAAHDGQRITTAGQLQSVRVVDFDLGKLDLSTVGDADTAEPR